MKQTTFVTIAYELDFRMLVLQAISLYRKFEHSQIYEYIIINNGKETNTEVLKKYFKNILPIAFVSKIRFLSYKEILSEEEYRNSQGQRTQQILKLRISKFINTKSYILLDAKNFFVRKANLDLFLHNEKYYTFFSNKVSEYWIPYIQNSLSIFAIDNSIFDLDKDKKMPTITPYVMDTESAKDLVIFLEKQYSRNIAKVFEKYHGKVTEFFIYFAYLIKTNKIDLLYKDSKQICITFFAQYPSEYGIVDKYIKEISENEEIYLIGLHKNRLAQLSKEHLEILKNVLYKHLLYPWEDLNWFLDYQNQDILNQTKE